MQFETVMHANILLSIINSDMGRSKWSWKSLSSIVSEMVRVLKTVIEHERKIWVLYSKSRQIIMEKRQDCLLDNELHRPNNLPLTVMRIEQLDPVLLVFPPTWIAKQTAHWKASSSRAPPVDRKRQQILSGGQNRQQKGDGCCWGQREKHERDTTNRGTILQKSTTKWLIFAQHHKSLESKFAAYALEKFLLFC